MGFSFEECKKINPRLIYASISGYATAFPHARISIRTSDVVSTAMARRDRPQKLRATTLSCRYFPSGQNRGLES